MCCNRYSGSRVRTEGRSPAAVWKTSLEEMEKLSSMIRIQNKEWLILPDGCGKGFRSWFRVCTNKVKELLQHHFLTIPHLSAPWVYLDDMLFVILWPVIKLYHKQFITKTVESTKVCEKWLYFSFKLKRTQGDPWNLSHILCCFPEWDTKG